MKKAIILALIACTLCSCAFFKPHRRDIEQGNIITQSEVSKLKVGMTESQVIHIMGTPMLTNIFTPDRIDYVYTLQYAYNPIQETRIICLFNKGRLREIITS